MYGRTGPSRGNRRPTVAAPGSSGATRPTRQRGGGGNKAAGSPEPTAASSTVAATLPTGQMYGATTAALRAAEASKRRATRAKRAATREERQKAAAALASVAASRAKRSRERATAPKPSTYLGRKTAGTPTKAELDEAHESGTLQVNKAGAVTIPAVRQASRHLRKAAAALETAGSTGELHSAIVTTPEQQKVVREILETGEKDHADRKEKLASLTTDLQESGSRNLPIKGPGGGWRQEELAFYPVEDITNVKKGADNFFHEARAAGRGRGETPAELSQAVQGSGAGEFYYEDNQPEARQLLRQYNRGKGNSKARRQLAAATKTAKELGLKPKAVTGTQVGPAPKRVVTRYKAARAAMSELDRLNNEGKQPYVWGGGHGTNPVGGADCSGSVSYVLEKLHILKKGESLTSGEMGSVLAPGSGALTVFYNGEHTFIYDAVKKEFWGTSNSNVEGGAGYFPSSVGRSEVASGNSAGAYNVGHIPGLGKKQALQLGGSASVPSGGVESIPGMTLSASGTTAAINPGAGTRKANAGYSKKPIKLTKLQRYNRAKRKLRSIGAPLRISTSSGRSGSHPILEELKAKYGSAPTAEAAPA